MRTIDAGYICVDDENIMVQVSCRASGDPKFIWGPQGRNTLGVGMTLGLQTVLGPTFITRVLLEFRCRAPKSLPPQVDQGSCLDVPGRLATLL